jgi:succinoglycan biosynthesis transport protein ExoP
MSHLDPQSAGAPRGFGLPDASSLPNAEQLLGMLRRHVVLIAATALLGLAIGAAYLLTSVPTFTASSALLIDNRKVRAAQEAYAFMSNGSEVADIDLTSQMEIFKSDKISAYVASRLSPQQLLAVVQPQPTVLKTYIAQVGSALGWRAEASAPLPPPDPVQTRLTAIERLRNSVTVRLVPRTQVLQISVTASDPALSAVVTNAFAEAYVDDQRDAQQTAITNASEWIKTQLAELKGSVLKSEEAVEKFKRENDLVSINGRRVDDQGLGDAMAQLMTLRADTTRLASRYDKLRAIIDGRKIDAVVSESFTDPVISQLRSRYVATAKSEAEISARLGREHDSAVKLRADMQAYEKFMFAELERIASGYKSELDISKTREKSLEESFARLTRTSDEANKSQIKLRELERSSETLKTLYATLLQRHQEALQQQSFMDRNARILTVAKMPTAPNGPTALRILAFAAVVGAVAGAGAGILRELSDKTFRTSRHVRSELGYNSVWMLPQIDVRRPKKSSRPAAAGQASAPDVGGLNAPGGALTYVLDNPRSHFAQTLQSIKIALDLERPGKRSKLVGVASLLPGEGKTTVAKNLASLLAQMGSKTLLIDADLIGCGLTQGAMPLVRRGILDAARDGALSQDDLVYEIASGLSMLPAPTQEDISHTASFLTSPGMSAVLRQAEDNFNYVVLDLPPFGLCADVHAIAPQLDALIIIVEWGQTERKHLREALEAEPGLAEKCIGIVINKINWNRQRHYESFDAPGFYHRRYVDYISAARQNRSERPSNQA